MKLSPHEIADLVIKAGFSTTTIVSGTTDTEAVVAVAIALAESGGDTENISRTTAALTSDPKSIGNRDHGLFQLSGRWQYDKIQAAGGNWRDPATNTAIAYKIFVLAKRAFTPWAVFAKNATTGIAPFEQYLPDARLGVMQPWPYVAETSQASVAISSMSTAVTNQLTKFAAQLTDVRKHFS